MSELVHHPRCVSVAEMVAVERAADAGVLSYAQMMEKAGRSLAECVSDAYSQIGNKSCVGLVGKGNNGGDTLIALEWLAVSGWQTAACITGRAADDALVNRLRTAGGKILSLELEQGFEELEEEVERCGLLLDGLLGTGTRLPLRDPMPQILQSVKGALQSASTKPIVVAVDCPSGVDCDSGEAAPETLVADLTVCMAAVKRGLLTLPAFGYVGRLEVVSIGLPDGFEPLASLTRRVMTASMAGEMLPNRPLDSHKGTFGRAMIVGGSRNYAGAPLLAGKAAFRSGAGWVTLAVPEPLQLPLAGHFPEATWLPLPHKDHYLSPDAVATLLAALERVTGLLVGPGLGRTPATAAFLTGLLAESSLPPLVLDAEALRLLAGMNSWGKRLPNGTILTPHPGEMADLTGLTAEEIQLDRLGAAERYALEWNCVVVLKGAFTLIAAPDGRTTVIPVATPALARAGTGDVLAGIITGLLAQRMPPFEAASAGAWLHGQAGLAAAQRLGSTAAVMAGDLVNELPGVMAVTGKAIQL
ncbi:MAG: NAD(P)H-hydrate dehydratase [Anaerolineae bacterium]|nr:MAG: NAD(P)H-hydrate dehydratase [Anaerolineae bacterium]